MRVAGVRTVIVLLNQRNLNLMEVNKDSFEFKRLSVFFFNHLFFFLFSFLLTRVFCLKVTEEVARLDKSSFGSVCLL